MKYLSGFLAFLLTLSVFLNTGVVDAIAASYDVTGPAIKSINIDKKEAQPGDSIRIQIEATDDDSGITPNKSKRFVQVKRVDGDQEHFVYFDFNETTSKYEGIYTVPDDAVNGDYYISHIHFEDEAENTTFISNPTENSVFYCSFVVSGANEDITGPTIKSISIDKTEAQLGDSILIQVDVTDDLSNISTTKNDRLVQVKRADGKQAEYVYLNYNETTGKYEGTYTVPDDVVNGDYYIHYIYFVDAVGNDTAIFPTKESDLYRSFSVSGGIGDVTGPTINSVAIDKTEVIPGEQILIQVGAMDESGITSNKSYRYVQVKRINGQQERLVQLDYNEATKRYEGTYSVPDNIVYGDYYISDIHIEDAYGNSSHIQPTDGSEFYRTFAVIDPSIPPNVTGVENEGFYNEPVTISFDKGKGTLNGESFKSGTRVTEEGEYVLLVKDAADNEITVKFTIDKTAPIVTGVKNEAFYKEEVTITFNEGTATLNGENFKSGTKVSKEGNYQLEVTDPAGNKTKVSFTIDKTAPVIKGVEDQGLYNKDVQITFNEGTATLNGEAFASGATVSDNGTYELIVKDTAGNSTTVSFTIDKTAPVVQGVKDQAYYNKDVIITFEEGTATLNGDEFNSGSTVSEEGSYKLVVKDAAGNSTTVSFTIDKTAPVVKGVEDQGLYNKDVQITFNEGKATLNGEVFSSGATVSDNGTYELVVKDTTGNSTTVSFTIDKVAPVVQGVKDKAYYNKDVKITFEEGKATLNGDEFKSGTTVSEEGSYKLVVKDAAGNATTISFTIDKTAPVVQGVKDQAYYNKDVEIAFEEGKATLNGNEFKSGATVSEEGSYKLVVKDTAGNSTTVSFTIDKAAPAIQGVKDQAYYNKDVKITFEEGKATLNGEAFTSGTTVSEEGSYKLVVKDTAGNSTTVSFTIDKTAPAIQGVKDEAYYNKDVKIAFEEGTATLNGDEFNSGSTVSEEGSYKLVVKDAAGNSTTVTFAIDKTAPVIKGVKDQGLYNKDVQITFNEGTAILNDDSTLESGSTISDAGNYKLVVKDTAGNFTTVSFTIDKTAPAVQGVKDKTYYNEDVKITFEEGEATLNGEAFASGTTVSGNGMYELVVKDNAGNSTTISFTIDKKAPVIGGVSHNKYYNKDVVVTFNEGNATLNGKTITSGSKVSVNGKYTLVVTDKAGNKTTVVFTIDKTAPKVTGVSHNKYYKQNVTIKFNEGTAKLNNANFKSGTIVSKAGKHTLVVTDKAGNKTTVVFTIDKTAPKVTGVSHNKYYNKNVTIKFNEGTAKLNNATFKSGTKVSKAGKHTLVVTDKAGNKTTVVFTIDKTAPKVTGVSHNKYYNKNVTIKFNEGTAKLNKAAFKSGTKVSKAGKYTLVVTDKAGNKTTRVFTIDKKAPSKPKVKTVTSKTKTVTGTAEKGAKIYIYKGKTKLGEGTVNSKGKYSVKIKAQKKKAKLTVYAKDKAGNKSASATVTVK